MLPDRSVLIGQKLVEKAKIQKFKCDILSNFQTMCDFGDRAVLDIDIFCTIPSLCIIDSHGHE